MEILDKPLVSIVVPCYNQGQYLPDTINSILASEAVKLEVIVVNDGSTDDSGHIARTLAEQFDSVVCVEQDNKGLAAARNLGFSKSTGDYICFIDSDDEIQPSKLAKQTIEMRQKNADCCLCDFFEIDGEGHTLRKVNLARDYPHLEGDISVPLSNGGFFPPHCPLIKRSALWHNPFRTGIDGTADLIFWLELCLKGAKWAYIGEPLVQYRRHHGSMSSNLQRMEDDTLEGYSALAKEYPNEFAKLILLKSRENKILRDINRMNKERRRYAPESIRRKLNTIRQVIRELR